MHELAPKQLASALGRSVRYVRWAVCLGLPVDALGMTTEEKARKWIKRTGFKIVRGQGQVSRIGKFGP